MPFNNGLKIDEIEKN